MTTDDEKLATESLAKRWYQLVAQGRRDIRPFSQIGPDLRNEFITLARDAMQIWSTREEQLRAELAPKRKPRAKT